MAEQRMEATTLLAVNGTLMRGLELNPNLLAVGATYVRDDETDACYRIWSIGDRHPAMIRTPGAGTRVALEWWAVPLAGLASMLMTTPYSSAMRDQYPTDAPPRGSIPTRTRAARTASRSTTRPRSRT